MTRRCSHCSHNGHNSRTCPNRGVKLFGVRLIDGSIRKSASMGNLTHYMGGGGGGSGSGSGSATPLSGAALDSPADTPDHPSAGSAPAEGYASEDFVAGSSSSRERKKGVPWTEDEHKLFLLGLQKLGKGDWRGIARNYVMSRTPTQVASHAQKYFIRQSNMSRRKRRSSLFDIVVDEEAADNTVMSREFLPVNPSQAETQSSTPAAVPTAMDEECESLESANSNDGDTALTNLEGSQYPYPVMYPAYVAPLFPAPIQFWPGYTTEPVKAETHEVVKPTAVHSKSPINVDELVGMSSLSLGESIGDGGPSALSLKLVEGSTRPSAFQANPASGSSSMNSNSHNPIHAL